MFILGFVIFLVSFALTVVVLGGNLTNFLNLPSLAIIIVPLIGVLTATKSFKVFSGGLRAVINPYRPLTEDMRGQAASLFRLLSKTTAIVIALNFIICTINFLLGVDTTNPNVWNAIRGNFAATLIPPFYGMILIAGLFEPVVFNLKKRRDTERK
jgi:flagellar motor component MotA